MASTSILIFLLLSSVMISYADWTLYVRLNSYSNPRRVYGTNVGGLNRYCCCTCPSTCCNSNVNNINCNNGGCNSRILICANQGSTAKSCVYSNIINSDTVNFGQGNVEGGLTNPVHVTVQGQLLNTSVQVNIEVLDDNGANPNVNPTRILNTQANLQSPQISSNFSSDTTVDEDGSNVILLLYATRTECATNYYQLNCSVYCIPTNDSIGHCTCDTHGNKICLPDYTNISNNCLDDSNTPKAIDIVEPVVGGTIGFILLIIAVILICCVNAVVIRQKHKRQSCNTQQVAYDIPTVSIPEVKWKRQPNTSAAPHPLCNSIVQTSRQQTYNGGTPFNTEDNPAYQLGGVAHGGYQPNYDNMRGTSFK